MKKILAASLSIAATLIVAGCSTDEPTPAPDIFDYERYEVWPNADLVYIGDDGGSEESDLYELTLYTDGITMQQGRPVGPGRVIHLSFNGVYHEPVEGETLNLKSMLGNIVGKYTSVSQYGGVEVGGFLWGSHTNEYSPGSGVFGTEVPIFCYYGELGEGERYFREPLLLKDGWFEILDNGNGTHTVRGCMIGTDSFLPDGNGLIGDYRKRYFVWTGTFEPHLFEPYVYPNSTLTEDFTLQSNLALSRVEDLGNYFNLSDGYGGGPESYRMFELYLAEASVDLYSQRRPQGSGNLLKVDLFVPYESDVKDGIPAGEYNFAERSEYGTYYPDQIVPYVAVEGKVNDWQNYDGSWWLNLNGDMPWTSWARMSGGKVTVERPEDGGHKITFDMVDCNGTAFSYVWESLLDIRIYSEVHFDSNSDNQ